jgi:hypothetical protein
MSTLLDLPPTKSAVISACGKYRYHLFRKVGDGGPVATFIMLNPSTADDQLDDPTIRKVMGFARRWGCGDLHVVNLFAFRATRPAELGKTLDPVGPENQEWVRRSVEFASDGMVVCAWGAWGGYMRQDEAVLGWIADLCPPMCLGVTRDGHPRHPLYLPFSSELVSYHVRRC